MSGKYFLDTNIFVYSFDTRDQSKQTKAQYLIEQAINQQAGCISYQVAQEFINVATRKFQRPLSPADAAIYFSNILEPLCEIYASSHLFGQALELAKHWKYAFYDALIIASAIHASCHTLYSEDLQHGQQIGHLKIINPFA